MRFHAQANKLRIAKYITGEIVGDNGFKQIMPSDYESDPTLKGIYDYAISEEAAIEVKKSIPSPWIKLTATGNLFKEMEIPDVFLVFPKGFQRAVRFVQRAVRIARNEIGKQIDAEGEN